MEQDSVIELADMDSDNNGTENVTGNETIDGDISENGYVVEIMTALILIYFSRDCQRGLRYIVCIYRCMKLFTLTFETIFKNQLMKKYILV